MEGETEQSGKHAAGSLFGGYLLSAVVVFGGLGIYFLVFEVLVDPLNPSGPLPQLDPLFLWEGPDPASPSAVLAADLDARYAFGVPTVLMTLALVAAIAVAFGMVLPQYGPAAIVLGVIWLAAGALIGFVEQFSNPLRGIVADCFPGIEAVACPLDQAVLRAPPLLAFDAGTLAHVQLLASYNSISSVAAIALIGICGIFVARSVPTAQLTPAYLVRRRIGLETMLTLVGPLLVFCVATTHGFYHFSSALMHPAQAEAYRQLASAGTTYWGAVYTTVLLVIAVPAAISVARDARRASRAALPDGNFAERREWRKTHGVELSIRDRLSVAVASFAPVLTTPLLDLLQESVGT